MNGLMCLLLLLQVEPFKIESKKITPEIRKQIDKLDDIRNDAFAAAQSLVGAKLPEKFEIVLEAVDGADPDPLKFKQHPGVVAETGMAVFPKVRIRFFIEYFGNGLGRHPESTLRHEMIHAVMRLDLGKEKYGAIPKWLREGIAVFGADQVLSKLAHELTHPDIAADPEKLIDGLEDADHTLSDYYEDAMGVLALVMPDRANLRLLEKLLRDGKGYREAIAEVSGKSFEMFVEVAKERALADVRKRTEDGREMLASYVAIANKNPPSKEECDRFLKKWPREAGFTSAVLYYRAKAAKDEGIPHFDEFIESYRWDGKVDFIDDAKLRKARLLAKQKKTQEAAEVYADLVRWHIGSPVAVEALYEWGLLLWADDESRGKALLKRALEIAPKHRLAERAKKQLE